MAVVKQVAGARTALTVSGLSTLASGSYATSAVKDNTGNQPLDLLIELSITPGAISGNQQAVLFAQASLDNTNFQTGANSSDESDMTMIGVLPLRSNTTAQAKPFSVAGAYGGVLPPYIRFVIKNDSGSAFSAGALNYSEISATVA